MIGNNTVVIFINNLKILLNQLFNLPSATLKSCLLVSISDSVSFARRPRSLKELDRWKATEYRSFLLYIGPIVMRNYLSNDVYSHFILLSSAARLIFRDISKFSWSCSSLSQKVCVRCCKILWSKILCLQCAQLAASSKWLFELWKTYQLWRFSIWESSIYHEASLISMSISTD